MGAVKWASRRPTRGELRAINRELRAVGERICSACWRRLPEAAFSQNGQFRRSQCRQCIALVAAQRFQRDADYRRRQLEAARRYRERNRERVREQGRRCANARYWRKKAEQFQRLLETA